MPGRKMQHTERAAPGGWGVENKTHLYYYPRRHNILLEHTPEYIYKIGRSKRSFSYSVVQSCPPAFDVV